MQSQQQLPPGTGSQAQAQAPSPQTTSSSSSLSISSNSQLALTTELIAGEVPAKLPQGLVKTICKIIDFYMEDKIDPEWLQRGLAFKQKANGVFNIFTTVDQARKIFCDNLKQDLSSTTIRSLCTLAINLGTKAEDAYNEHKIKLSKISDYSIFFLLAHAIRNLIVKSLKENYKKEYEAYTAGLIINLDKYSKDILQQQRLKNNVEELKKLKTKLKKNLAFLENDEAGWKIQHLYTSFNQPGKLSEKAADDPNKPFFLQDNFGPDFINSAYQSLLNCSLNDCIKKMNIEVQQGQVSTPTQ